MGHRPCYVAAFDGEFNVKMVGVLLSKCVILHRYWLELSSICTKRNVRWTLLLVRYYYFIIDIITFLNNISRTDFVWC